MDKARKKNRTFIIRNNLYVLRLIAKASPARLPFYFLSIVLSVAANFLFNVYLLRLVINSINSAKPFSEIVRFIIAVGVLLMIYYIFNNFFTKIFVPVSDKKIYLRIQKQVFGKAERVDLSCYENPEFYNKYVKAVNETGVIAQTVLKSMGNMAYSILTILTTSLFIFLIDPIFILFTVIPVIYTLLFGKKLNRLLCRHALEYQFRDKEKREDCDCRV